MSESYSVKARLSAVDSGFSSTLKNAMGLADSFGSKLSGFNFGILTGVGQAAFGVLKDSVSGLVSEMSASNAAWKTFTGNMEMLGKSSSEISSVKKELQAFAEQSVYSSSDMASTYAQLAAVGTKNTTQLVKGFGGLAAAAENPQQAMKTLSQQATQMAAKPNVAWADFKLMLEQTPAGIAAVAKEMGMSSAEMVTAVQEGTIATDEFFDAIAKVGTNKAFSKMATEYKTIGAAMDGLQETIGNKLTPAFDVLSQVGIDAISGISDMLGGIDAQALADNVSSMVKTAGEFLGILKDSFSGVGTAIGSAASAIKTALGGVNGEFSKTDAMNNFKSACDSVAGVIKKVAGFIEQHADTIAKALPYVAKLAGAFLAFKAVNSIAPGLTSFAGSLLKMAGKGIAGLAGKLLGIAGGQKAVGTASAASGPSILQSALATLALGAAVLLAAAGMGLLVQSAIALASAGWPAVGALVALVAVVALLAIGAAALGPALTAGAVGFIAFGAAIALIGAGAALAGLGLQLMASALPMVVAFGAQAAVALVQLGASLALFAIGAALTGAAVIVLGAGLLIVASALVLAGAAMVLFGVGALIAAGALALISLVMPTLVQYGAQAAIAFVQLGAGLLIFGAGALVAGAGALVLGAGLLVVAAAVVLLGAGMLILSMGALITAASLAIMAAILPILAAYGTQGALAIALLGASLLVFALGAGVAGVAALALSVGLLAATIGFAAAALTVGLLAAAMALLAVSTLLAAAGFGIIGSAILVIIAYGAMAAVVLTSMNLPLFAFVPAATAAGAAATVLALGFAAAAIATAALGIAVLALGIGLLAVGAGSAVAAGGMLLLSMVLPLIAANAQQNVLALTMLAGGLATFALGAAAAGLAAGAAAIAIGAFGIAIAASAIGVLAMGVALKGVQSSMKSIAKNAKSAEKALDNMQDAVDVVDAGLSALGDKAKSAMKKLTSAFDDTAGNAKASGLKVGTGFTMGMQTGLALAPAIASSSVTIVNTTLLAGYASAYNAGAFISRGFANGMLSQLGAIESAASRMAAAADKAVRAKAKIHSPSKVAEGLGAYWGEGYVGGILGSVRDAWRAAEELVSVPQIATPKLASAYGGELGAEYNYQNRVEYVIEVPLNVDRKEFARAFASTFQEEGNRKQTREDRKLGRV